MHDAARAMFRKVCLANIDHIPTLPRVLPEMGFVETHRLGHNTGPEDTSTLFQNPYMPFAFSCFEGRKDWPRVVNLVVSDTSEAREGLLTFVKSQSALTETTQQVWKKNGVVSSAAPQPVIQRSVLVGQADWRARDGFRDPALPVHVEWRPCGRVEPRAKHLAKRSPPPAEQAALIAEGTPLQKNGPSVQGGRGRQRTGPVCHRKCGARGGLQPKPKMPPLACSAADKAQSPNLWTSLLNLKSITIIQKTKENLSVK
jgi:hypothetical protein